MDGAQLVYDAVSTTYGPKGSNVLVEKVYGFPVLTRDGNAVAREVYVSDRAVNLGTQLLLEASNTTNHNVGDGNTQTIVLAYNLIKLGQQRIAAGVDPMVVREELKQDSYKLRDFLQTLSKPIAEGQLKQVATVSCGDTALGELIAESVEEVGSDGGIVTERALISGVDRRYINGYFLQQGFNAISQGKKEIENCYVVTSSKHITSGVDALQLLNQIALKAHQDQGLTDPNQPLAQPLRIAFFGEFEGDAYNTIVANIQKGSFDGVVVKSPPVGDMSVKYLEDVAIYTGGKNLAQGDSIASFDATYIGRADKVSCTPSETTIFGGQGAAEDIEVRTAEIKDRLKTEEVSAIIEKLRDRIAKLEGRIAIFRIGGSTDTEREELEFRIEDAIQATKAAAQYGVVPGGGATLVALSYTENISYVFQKALQACFKKLVENAGMSGEVKLAELIAQPTGTGFNLRKGGDPVNLIQEGILDPTQVLEEVIKNAASTAGSALTTGCLITFIDKKEE